MIHEPESRMGAVLATASREAVAMGHRQFDTCHLLLGLVSEGGPAAAHLHSWGVTFDGARAQVVDLLGTAPPPVEPVLPTARCLSAFTKAAKEAAALGGSDVEPEHLLLAILADIPAPATPAAMRSAILSDLRAEEKTARQRRRTRGVSDLVKCSFCGKDQKSCKKLIAGPGVYICDECIWEANSELVRDELRTRLGSDAQPSWGERVVHEGSTKCNFCSKFPRQVRRGVLAGPGVHICAECVDLCNDILREEGVPPT